ncbi:MAG: hypothetical protein ACO36A_02590 [Ilumatobacteraceae bacterium]
MTDRQKENDDQTRFLWSSIVQLEDRITTVDNKGNILIGLSLALAAASVTFGLRALEVPTGGRREEWVAWVVLPLVIAALAVSAGIVLIALKILNPKGATPVGKGGYALPENYVVWPAREVGHPGRPAPWKRSPLDHITALESLGDRGRTENLLAMQTTLVFLMGAKYDHYRRAITFSRRLVWVQIASIAASAAAVAFG